MFVCIIKRAGNGSEHSWNSFVLLPPPLLRLGPSATTSPRAVSSINKPFPDTETWAPSHYHCPKELHGNPTGIGIPGKSASPDFMQFYLPRLFITPRGRLMMETNAQFSMVLLPRGRRESWQGRREHECWQAQDKGFPAQELSEHRAAQQGERKGGEE